jgi:NADH:ubiquinone oxidoreductase subunit
MLRSMERYPQDVDVRQRPNLGWTPLGGAPIVRPHLSSGKPPPVLKAIFTWWNGATIGARFTIAKSSRLVGTDEFGNKYFEAITNKGSYDARKRRYVIYKGYAEPSKIPPDWHGWMHYTFDEPPTVAPLKRQVWELDHVPNLTGTIYAWRPPGSISQGGQRPQATGDYEAWKPE